ncbi:hypothetical protein GIB67_017324 [Kingdonia uniflora]|uniref:DM2 domain-containing protein n=1 Tax=Kingdonia uniflora TaxID=39325 RepID=A0A7J7LCD9_9MAGN|nr:hypothetical protein GIB67_036990 [Kingdonia uniflora]KAF6162436.1 hypothetical protein GIB67_017324 [Kingdonia uniflora]
MSLNNNVVRNIGGPSPLGNAGLVSSSLSLNQPSHLHAQSAQTPDGSHFRGQFPPPVRNQALTQAFTQAQSHQVQSQQQAAHAQFQSQMQAQSPGVVGHVGASSPSLLTPANAGAKRVQQKPPARPPGSFTTNSPSPYKTMELTPAARKKKRKLPEWQLPDRVAALLPESAFYTQLLEFEARVDAALARKKIDIQNPLKILLIIGRILEEGMDADAIGTNQRPNSSYPKFSSFFKRVTIALDSSLYPENPTIVWENARSPALHEGFEVKRKGDKEFNANIRLEMNYMPENFKLSPALTEVLGIEVDTRPRIIAAIWYYVKARKLQNPSDPAFFSCDMPLRKVFGEEKMKFSMVSQKISQHLSPPQPIHLEHRIKLSGSNPAGSACYDVLVDVPFPLQREMSSFLANTEKHKEIDACDDAICAAIKKIHEHRRRRAFFLGFSQSPVEFINALIASQNRDLKLVAGEASRNAEKERRLDFYNQPWVEDAVIRYLNRKPAAGSDVPGST